MKLSRKFISHAVWIILATILGVGISYWLLVGGSHLSDTISKITKQLTTKNVTSASEYPEYTKTNIILPEIKKTRDTVSIGFVGDIIPNINAAHDAFGGTIAYTERPDIMIGNFEGVVSDHTYSKCGEERKNCFAFNGDDNFLQLLASASFDVLNVANNHFNDFGQTGQEETLIKIADAGMMASGVKDEITYIKNNDAIVAVVGFSSYYWSTSMNNADQVKELVSKAEQNADIVVVVFHGGGEGEKYSHTPVGIEWFLGENRGDLRTFAHNAIDAGADIVLGSGPHVLRGIEQYQGKLIAYSLGNFSYANAFASYGTLKTSAMIEITFDRQASLVSGRIFPFEIDKYGAPNPDLNNTAISLINDLSKSDFNQGPILNSGGEIILK